jgi:MFS family permease
MTTTQTSPPATNASKLSFIALLTTSILGMALLGLAAFLAFVIREEIFSQIFSTPETESEETAQVGLVMLVVFGTFGSGVLGGMIGFIISPLLAWLLPHTNRVRALMAIFALCLLPTIIWAYFEPWLMFGASAAMPASLSVVALSAIRGVRCRRIHLRNTFPDLHTQSHRPA